MTRVERMKLVVEYTGTLRTVGGGSLSRVERMRASVRMNQIRTQLGAGKTPAPENPHVATLREILSGARDALGLQGLLDAIGSAVDALHGAGELLGDIEELADRAITHWATLEAAEA